MVKSVILLPLAVVGCLCCSSPRQIEVGASAIDDIEVTLTVPADLETQLRHKTEPDQAWFKIASDGSLVEVRGIPSFTIQEKDYGPLLKITNLSRKTALFLRTYDCDSGETESEHQLPGADFVPHEPGETVDSTGWESVKPLGKCYELHRPASGPREDVPQQETPGV